MASPTQWTWVWVGSGSWWWTGRPGILQSMGVTKSWTQLSNWTDTDIDRHGAEEVISQKRAPFCSWVINQPRYLRQAKPSCSTNVSPCPLWESHTHSPTHGMTDTFLQPYYTLSSPVHCFPIKFNFSGGLHLWIRSSFMTTYVSIQKMAHTQISFSENILSFLSGITSKLRDFYKIWQ